MEIELDVNVQAYILYILIASYSMKQTLRQEAGVSVKN